MSVHRVFPRAGRQPSLSCPSCLTQGSASGLLILIRAISRQFIARYVHDLIVKHNVRDLSDYPDRVLTCQLFAQLKQLWDVRDDISKDGKRVLALSLTTASNTPLSSVRTGSFYRRPEEDFTTLVRGNVSLLVTIVFPIKHIFCFSYIEDNL
jgi:hypothetical protein